MKWQYMPSRYLAGRAPPQRHFQPELCELPSVTIPKRIHCGALKHSFVRPIQRNKMAAEAEYWSFPTNPEEFDQDERISFSRLDNKYIAVQDDGTEYEFDEGLKRWIPMIDEALIEQQQQGYMMPDADADDDRRGSGQGRKRKMDHSNDREVSCARMHTSSVGRPARRHALLLPP